MLAVVEHGVVHAQNAGQQLEQGIALAVANGLPLALGSPSTMSARTRSALPMALKERISSFTQREAAARGEQMTMRYSEQESAFSMMVPRLAEVGSSSLSRKMG